MGDETAPVEALIRTETGRAGLAAVLDDPSGAVIGLDFDGTLSPIVPDPASARIHPEAPAALVRLGELVRAVVIVTGRPPLQALALGEAPGGPALADVPGLVVLGHYGLERWEGGDVTAPPPPPGLDRVRAELPSITRAFDGVLIEDKGRAVAVHTRRASDPEGALLALGEPVAKLAAASGLIVEPGRLVLELRPPGMDKGQALRAFLAERSARSVMFFGDDLGDIAAFDAVATSGLPGVRVCSGSAEVTRLVEHADAVVDGPEGVVRLLRSLVATISPAGA
ncbi:trehalose-phosphatase [Microtetraspora sp. AC03309]|uniref:trehalose-phosphatase n=1 Tax=Microtetraspora sp. AC03309 TaxID=2779376 RepID=UPI001E61B9CE|nr:trehalose-phosphatase [Microtetraspora sp. AC03309]MCC5577381.1 trehalose-phosphatase [Microtetraspora sp. AC03309]